MLIYCLEKIILQLIALSFHRTAFKLRLDEMQVRISSSRFVSVPPPFQAYRRSLILSAVVHYLHPRQAQSLSTEKVLERLRSFQEVILDHEPSRRQRFLLRPTPTRILPRRRRPSSSSQVLDQPGVG
jgi:hypothetical protein